MRLRGKLLRTVEQQRAGSDPEPIDPSSVHFDPGALYALRLRFNDDSPPIGTVRVSRAPDGSLDAVASFYDETIMADIPYIVRFAIGTSGGTVHDDGLRIAAYLNQVAITEVNVDRGMPLARMEG